MTENTQIVATVVPEQATEWTYPLRPRLCGMYSVHYWFYSTIFGFLTILFVILVPRPLLDIAAAVVLICTVLILLLAVLGERPARKLRINRHVVVLISTGCLGTHEHQIKICEAKIRAVHLDFFERLFTFDLYRTASAYHVEIIRNGESFLFPCADETEQRQIIAQFKEFGLGDVR